jgi:hypothetical protein
LARDEGLIPRAVATELQGAVDIRNRASYEGLDFTTEEVVAAVCAMALYCGVDALQSADSDEENDASEEDWYNEAIRIAHEDSINISAVWKSPRERHRPPSAKPVATSVESASLPEEALVTQPPQGHSPLLTYDGRPPAGVPDAAQATPTDEQRSVDLSLLRVLWNSFVWMLKTSFGIVLCSLLTIGFGFIFSGMCVAALGMIVSHFDSSFSNDYAHRIALAHDYFHSVGAPIWLGTGVLGGLALSLQHERAQRLLVVTWGASILSVSVLAGLTWKVPVVTAALSAGILGIGSIALLVVLGVLEPN